MKDSYKHNLLEGFWSYRNDIFKGKDDYFDNEYRSEETQPPVFKPEHAAYNVLLRPDFLPEESKSVWSAVPSKERHKWFRSMSSSQALSQSIFANLKFYNMIGLLANLHGKEGLPPFYCGLEPQRCIDDVAKLQLELEYKIDRQHLGEPRPTSVDVMFMGSYRIAIECKLSEQDVGSCSRPRLSPSKPNYARDQCNGVFSRQRNRTERCSLSERGINYWQHIPRLFNWPVGVDMDPCPLNKTFQLVRNVLAACIQPDGSVNSNGHAVLLYDKRNPSFTEGGKGIEAYKTVRQALKNPEHLRRCTWQELVNCIKQDKELDWLTEGLSRKYGL